MCGCFEQHFLVLVMTDGIASIVAALPLGASAVFEATGGYGRPLMDALEMAGVRQALLDTTHVRKFVSATGRPAVTARLPRLCDADRSVIGGVDKVTCLGASLVSHQTGLCDEAACGGEAPRFWASSSREEHCRTG